MNTYMSYITDELKSLTSIPSPSGFTKEVTAYVHKVLTDMGYEPYFSNKGNVHVTLGGEGHPLLLAAHLDTLGAMVRSIKNNGRLRPTTLGGHQWTTCDGENCTVHTRDGKVYTGVVLNTEPSAHVADEKAERKEENPLSVDALGGVRESQIIYSCIPWADITMCSNERDYTDPKLKDDTAPILVWGKYTERDGKYIINMTLDVNHRFIDGYFVGQFVQKLEMKISELE